MKAKNIIFITTDQQRADTMNSKEYYTPNLNQFAEDSIQFSDHICTSAQCAPSRATWMTGKYPHEVGVNVIGHKLDPDDDNIAKEFNKGGYETVYFGKWHLGGAPKDYGFQVTDYRTDDADFWGANEKPNYLSHRDALTTAQTLNYLEDYQGDNSFFMHVSWYLPHPNNPHYVEKGPFENVDAFHETYNKEEIPVPESYYADDLSTKPEHQRKRAMSRESKLTEDIVKSDGEKYRKLTSLMDRNLGKILEKLKEKNLLDNTMIVFSSDHGDMQGAHRLRLKGVLPYKELYHIPLIVHLPWLNSKRKVISDLTSNASLAGTLLDAANLPVPEGFYPSLLPLLEKDEEEEESYVFIEHYKAYWGQHPFRGIQSKKYKYVYYYDDDVEEMYDLQIDPNEIHNVYEKQEYQSVKKKLREKLDEWWEDTGALTKEPIIDTESNWGKATSKISK
ncbi:sulfatase-like hydrolase/transferase [Gracilibacillus sp. YIM 98692]|uniref:sulfatase family protein n=1 Tax=Gracilibacillus sp. YIM 98692 TaxID=2663532 RepID=UPI0013D7F4C2|nr:sulfatase-like hydrolase/transferase [Gracilibacillus sp. YIM 98692]